MQTYEYSVIPAPKRGVKARGIKGPEAQFANALTRLMNEAAAQGWEYLRAETLPAEERQGLTGRTTVFQNMLVFRRSIAAPEPEPEVAAPVEPPLLERPEPEEVEERPLELTAMAATAAASLRPEEDEEAETGTEEEDEEDLRPTP